MDASSPTASATLPACLGHAPDVLAVDDLTRSRSWGELDDRVARLRGLFAVLDVQPGDHVAMVMGNRVEFVELVLAALTSGAWLTPVNRHAPADEIAYVLDDSGASLVFSDPEHSVVTRDAAGRRRIIEVGDEYERLLSDQPALALDPTGVPGGNMIYTSGTTGRPKGVKRGRQATIYRQLDALKKAGAVLRLDGGGPHLVTGPLYHAAPLGFAIMDLLNGASMIVMSTFDAARTLELIAARQVHNTHLVPTMFVRLLRLDDGTRDAFDATSLATVLHGAAPISPVVKERMIAWWGPVLFEYWGASEGGVVTLVSSTEWVAKRGTVGRPTANHEVFVTDANGRILPTGETGLLWCRNITTDDVFEYHGDRDKTASAFRGPGTYSIGDIGRVDDDGFVFLADRASNMIISGGVNIYPAEVEAALMEHPAVADVAVFGIPDDEWGESVRAAVQLRGPTDDHESTERELIVFARQRLTGYKAPRSIEFHAELPRAPTGKLATRVLKDPHWRDRDGRI